jgi:hypothetical protein
MAQGLVVHRLQLDGVMRMKLVVAAWIGLVGACGSDHNSDWTDVGECDPESGATELTVATPTDLYDSCVAQSTEGVNVVETQAQWDALFDCAQPLPDNLDLATQRAAVIRVQCRPIDYRFTAETAGEVVVGVFARISGACIGNVIVVPLPASTKPVRLATCEESCNGDCPPVP